MMKEHQHSDLERPRLLGSPDSRPAILKFGFPFILWLSVVELYQPPEKPGGLVLLGLIATAGFFLFTLTLITANSYELQYRRFIRWHTIDYQEILKCRPSIIPGLGYLKLKRFIPPWGRLYFVFYTPSAPFIGRSKQRAMIQYIQDRMAGRPEADAGAETKSEATAAGPKRKRELALCALWSLSGFAWPLFIQLALGYRPTIPTPSVFAHENMFYRLALAWWRFGLYLLDWPSNLFVIIVLFALIVAMRFKRRSWGPAAALGMFLGELVARFFQGYG